ncbi:MAG: eL32 family ribosomal protein [Candidatus Pacearchaeota archaeon]|jgi:large subunit ribosomal protein L32e
MIKRKPKFLRIGYTQYSKLGLRRKKKQIYRKSKGIDNKVRLKMKGHLRNINIGYRGERKLRSLINKLKPILVHNIEEIKSIKKNEVGILAKIGMKKKIEIANYILKNNIRINNLNAKKFLEKTEEKLKERKEGNKKKEDKIKERSKRAKEAEKKAEDKKEEPKAENNESKKETKVETKTVEEKK